ncbi:hypothetical protein G6F68_011293 [Rhizopus microsporus]|nr:hypothetical protein G6F68_011293 [Rhizopus microsporus]
MAALAADVPDAGTTTTELQESATGEHRGSPGDRSIIDAACGGDQRKKSASDMRFIHAYCIQTLNFPKPAGEALGSPITPAHDCAMLHPTLPLNALRAFEAAARHQNFTRAALELCVSQAALSHQIRGLEDRLGIRLFHRLPRGVALTDEGAALYPVLNESFERISASIARYTGGPAREVLTLGVVGTFATGWLLPRLAAFEAAHPDIELRLQTHNNRIDLAGEGLDLAIRFATARPRHAAVAALLPQRRVAALAAGDRGQWRGSTRAGVRFVTDRGDGCRRGRGRGPAAAAHVRAGTGRRPAAAAVRHHAGAGPLLADPAALACRA